jgi:hypothetical protein
MGDVKAVALAVKLAASGVRRLGFHGSTPHLERELPDGTIHLVNFQRVVSGVTGREPGFTVNLNVVSKALREAWAAKDDWRAKTPLRSGADIGVSTRLGAIGVGEDRWWQPENENQASVVADEVVMLMERFGLPWLERVTEEVTR